MSMWEPARPCRSPPPSRRARGAFTYVVTPDRIPQFIIPSLAAPEGSRLLSQGKEPPCRSGPGQLERKVPWRRSSEPAAKNQPALWGAGLGCISAELAARVEEIPDPVTRAALSLLHLPKITTPYGFPSLGQSPQVTTEEALLSQSHGAYVQCPGAWRQPTSREQPGRCCQPEVPGAHTDSCSGPGGYLRDCRQPPSGKGTKGSPGCAQPAGGSQLTGVRQGMEAEDSQGKQKPLPIETDQSSFSAPGQPANKHRRKFFQSLLKKHFAQLRNFPLH